MKRFKLQACKFKRTEDSEFEYGFAKVKEFGLHDCLGIIDQNLQIVIEIWNFWLLNDQPGHLAQVSFKLF